MADPIVGLLDTERFIPRWSSGDWAPVEGWLHIVSDLAIMAAYVALPALALHLLRRRDAAVPRVFWLVAAVLLACGVTHGVEALIFWHPVYRLSGLLKLTTALASWAAVFALVPYLAGTVGLRSREELERDVEAAKKRDSQLVAIVSSSRDAILALDLSGRILEWNPGAARIYGHKRDAILGESMRCLVPEDETEAWSELVTAFAQGTTSSSLVSGQRLTKDAKQFTVASSWSLIRDAQGAPSGISVIERDLTTLIQAQRLLRVAVDGAATPMVLLEDGCAIQLANSRAANLLGAMSEDLVGRSFLDFLAEAERPRFESWIGALDATTVPTSRQVSVLVGGGPDGVDMELTATREGLGERSYVLVSAESLLERDAAQLELLESQQRMELEVQRRTRQLRTLNEDLEEFAYAASHDLKAPLRGIHSLCCWLQDDLGAGASEETNHTLGLLLKRVHRMERLLDDLREYASTGRTEAQLESVAVGDVVLDAVDTLGVAKAHTVEVVGEVPVILTARAALSMVFRNLIDNAIKHHPGEAARVEVRCVADSAAGAEFTVDDDGAGIPDESKARVFQPFQTLRSRDEVEGSGLGLPLIRRLVQRHGGRVAVEDSPLGGARFRFSWRYASGSGEGRGLAAPPEPEGGVPDDPTTT